MDYIVRTLDNLVHQTAFMNLSWGNSLMIVVALVFMYLAIAKEFEPLLLVPISFGTLLVNIYPDIMAAPTETANGGLLYYFFQLDEWAILPSLIFMGVGAMTDFGPLIASPISFLMGAAAQFGIFAAYFGAIALGFNGKAAAAISIIGGADGPTSIFLCSKLGQTELLGPIAVAAYSYMSLVPIIQPPIMKLFTSEKDKKIRMSQLRPVSKLEKILFPIVVTIVVCMILPTTAPLVGMLSQTAHRDSKQRPDVHRSHHAGYFCRRHDQRRGVPERHDAQDRSSGSDRFLLRNDGRRFLRPADEGHYRRQGQSSDRICRRIRRPDGGACFPEGWLGV